MDTYQFAEIAAPEGAPLLIALHGTGGDERSLRDLGHAIVPGAHVIAPRGDVREGAALRFFRRTGEGVYDMADLARATAKLGAFVDAQQQRIGAPSVFALGYSNGANVLANLLVSAPGAIERVVLMHPLIPFAATPQPALKGRRVLITAGRRDPIGPAPLTQQLADYFEGQGAETSLVWHDGGHDLRQGEIAAAAEFLR